MKHIFALGTVMLSGALLAGACVASDSDNDPDTTENFGGAGGTGGDGGSGGNDGGSGGGSSTTTTTAADGGSGGSGGTYASGGSGGTYASGGSAGETSNGAGGWAGDDGTTSTESTTSTTSTTGNGGSGGACLGDDAVEHVPNCEDLEFAHVECNEFNPPEPFGMTHCKQFAEHAKPEVFKALFDCLDAIDVIDACSYEHDEAVRLCRDGDGDFEDDDDDGVIPLTCESDLAREKCANLGCPEVDTEVDGECDVYLSAFTPAGVDHVITCTNEFTGDVEGGEWGAGPDTTGCGDQFRLCVIGVNQPAH